MSDYIDDEEQLARLKSWWDENGTSVIGAVVVAVVGIVGWNWYGDRSNEQNQAQTQLLQAYQDSDDSQRGELSAQLAADFEGSAAHSLVQLDEARAAIESGEFGSAQEILQSVVESADDDLLADLARLRLAKVQQELDLSDEALNTLAAVKNEGYRSLALEIQGDIHAVNGSVEQAHLAYQAAVDSLRAGDTRPLLEMKLVNAEPFDGQYVEMTDQLTEALKEAASSLNVQVPEEAETATQLPAAEPETPVEVEAAPGEPSP